MYRTSMLIVMAFAIFFLHGHGFARAQQTTRPTGIRAMHCKTSVVPAEDDGDDDGDDGADSGATE